jgi:DNA-binding response OmpR family regulator
MAPRILLVEDDRAIRLTVEHVLAAEGYTVMVVATAAGAVRAVDACPFDVVILDVNLPDGTGWDVARHIRRAGGVAVPIVIISAMPPRATLIRAVGVAGLLVKPFPMESLLLLIDHLVGEAKQSSGEPSVGVPAVDGEAKESEAPGGAAVRRRVSVPRHAR